MKITLYKGGSARGSCTARLHKYAEDAFATGASLPVQDRAAGEVAAQAWQAHTPKQLVLITCMQRQGYVSAHPLGKSGRCSLSTSAALLENNER
jgi:hypothetical protein